MSRGTGGIFLRAFWAPEAREVGLQTCCASAASASRAASMSLPEHYVSMTHAIIILSLVLTSQCLKGLVAFFPG